MPFEERFIDWGGSKRGYQIFVPEAVVQPLPAILFLHGMGESGEDNQAQTQVGIGKAIRSGANKWPFLVILPQKKEAGILWPAYSSLLDQILKQVAAEFVIDPRQQFITGLSQGGNGTLTLMNSLVWKFRAAAAICGWADPYEVLKSSELVPLWMFHGEKDDVIPPSCSQAVFDMMKARGIQDVKLTLLPDADHNSWDDAYQKSGLIEWFLSREERD